MNDPMNQHLSSLRGLLSQTSVKLVLALIGIFLFFRRTNVNRTGD